MRVAMRENRNVYVYILVLMLTLFSNYFLRFLHLIDRLCAHVSHRFDLKLVAGLRSYGYIALGIGLKPRDAAVKLRARS